MSVPHDMIHPVEDEGLAGLLRTRDGAAAPLRTTPVGAAPVDVMPVGATPVGVAPVGAVPLPGGDLNALITLMGGTTTEPVARVNGSATVPQGDTVAVQPHIRVRAAESPRVASLSVDTTTARPGRRVWAPGVVAAAQSVLLRAMEDDVEAARYIDPFEDPEARGRWVVAVLRPAVRAARANGSPLAALDDEAATLAALYADAIGLGPAQPYLDDPRVNEVKINGMTVLVQEAGQPFVVAPERFATADEVVARAQLFANLTNTTLDAAHPQATVPLRNGNRMHLTIPPRMTAGALICVRRGRTSAWDLTDLAARSGADPDVVALLTLLAQARAAVLVVGRTNSGKTTLVEALANSWPAETHIVSIEDHALEIGIRRDALWTREVVDTTKEPDAFGRVAREALRQSPGLVIVGETRGAEAGAIIALLGSDHPVMTTVHAANATDGLRRLADYAALPGSYLYAGRRAAALRDACAGVVAVVACDFREELGQRVITEIALVAGMDDDETPRLIPLVVEQFDVDAPDRLRWQTFAVAVDGRLMWHDGVERTPERLTRLLRRIRRLRSTGAGTTIDSVRGALDRAQHALRGADPVRAVRELATAWATRPDGQLLTVAQQAIATQPGRFDGPRAAGSALWGQIMRAVRACRWEQATTLYATLRADLAQLAAAAPAEGVAALEAQLVAGQVATRTVEAAVGAAMAAVAAGQGRAALDALEQVSGEPVGATTLVGVLRVREHAIALLVAEGTMSSAILDVVRDERAALEREEGGA